MAMPREDDVAGHGICEDVAVVEVDDSVEQAAGGGEEHGVRERFGWTVSRGSGMVMWIGGQVREYLECGWDGVSPAGHRRYSVKYWVKWAVF